MEDLTEKDLEKMLKNKRKESRRKRRMKTSKKALYIAFAICMLLIFFTMSMIWLNKDTTSLGILATAGVGILPIMYGIYERGSTKENLKHMEMNYTPDYDEKEGIY